MKPRVVTCACGRRFVARSHNACRCPECREKYRMAYAHAYRRGVFLSREDYAAYYERVWSC